MKKILIGVLALGSLSTFAAVSGSARLDPGFYTSETLPAANLGISKETIIKVEKATTVLALGISGCSGAYISKHGHFLTAAHCLERIFKKNQRGSVVEYKSGPIRGTLIDADRVLSTPKIIAYHLTLGDALITFTGSGVLLLDGEWFVNNTFSTNDPWYHDYKNRNEDFAIIQVTFPRKPYDTCLKVKDTLSLDDLDRNLVFTYSKPKKGQRDGVPGPDGINPYFSYGYTTRDYSNSDVWRNLFQDNLEKLSSFNSFLLGDNKILSNTDANPGTSGSPLINQKGEIIGVNFAKFFIKDITTYSNYQLESVRSDFIIKRVKEKLGAEKAAMIFDCP